VAKWRGWIQPSLGNDISLKDARVHLTSIGLKLSKRVRYDEDGFYFEQVEAGDEYMERYRQDKRLISGYDARFVLDGTEKDGRRQD
jgi:hypothetical protein